MNFIYAILDKKPLIGAFSAFLGGLIPFIEAITPILQFLGVILGLLIGVMTVIEKRRSIKTKKAE